MTALAGLGWTVLALLRRRRSRVGAEATVARAIATVGWVLGSLYGVIVQTD